MKRSFQDKALEKPVKAVPTNTPAKTTVFEYVFFSVMFLMVSVIICFGVTNISDRVEAYVHPPKTVTKYVGFNPPEYLLINGERWYTAPYTFQGTTQGITECETRRIFYSGVENNSAALREIMWHELGHALVCNKRPDKKSNWGYYMNTKEHEIVYPLGMFMSGFVHDNPQFMDWAEHWETKQP